MGVGVVVVRRGRVSGRTNLEEILVDKDLAGMLWGCDADQLVATGAKVRFPRRPVEILRACHDELRYDLCASHQHVHSASRSASKARRFPFLFPFLFSPTDRLDARNRQRALCEASDLLLPEVDLVLRDGVPLDVHLDVQAVTENHNDAHRLSFCRSLFF